VIQQAWTAAGLPAEALGSLRLTGADPVLPSSFAVGAAAQASIALSALAAAELHHQRGAARQTVSVDMRHAAAEFVSERLASIEGSAPQDLWDPLAGAYPTRDGRFVRIHTNFPHHRDGILRILGCAAEKDAVAAALATWDAFAFEDAAAGAGMCATAMRTFAEWDAHAQGQAVAAQPLVSVTRIGDAPPEPLPQTARPLAGVRVLDLTRVLAGPVCARTLAAHGADVLAVSSPNRPNLPTLVMDTGRGKRTAFLELREKPDNERLRALLAGADVFLQGYRPGGLAALGFGPHDATRARPGIVYVSLSAYGSTGPWSGRRGFDSLTQTASGMNHAEAEAAGASAPRALPCQALDHAAGYLLAFGALTALIRRATEGGSWHVQVSLARTGRWIRDMDRIPGGLATAAPDFSDLLEVRDSPWGGRLSTVRHAALLSDTPTFWERPSAPLGTHAAAW
jgi:hypothetical protein